MPDGKLFSYYDQATTGVRISRSPSLHVVRIAVMAIISLITVPRAPASTVFEASLSSLSRKAGVVFAGTVSNIESGWDRDHKTIVTRVTFSQLDYVKGARNGKQLTLNLQGGTVGNEGIVVDGQPEFRVGSRYVLLCSSDLGSARNAYIPIAGLYQGFFPVATDSASGLKVVHDWEMRPLAAVQNGHAVVVSRRSYVRPNPSIRIHDGRDGLGRPLPDSVVRPARASQSKNFMGTTRVTPMEVVDRESDPMTRISEKDFLGILRSLASEK